MDLGLSLQKNLFWRLLLLVGASLMGMFLFVSSVNAAVVTWQGDVDNNWSTDLNWNGDSAPGSGDVATFDGTGNVACTIDATIDVSGIDINSGYTQTITQATGVDITIGAGNYDQADGTFTGSSTVGDDIDLNGNFVLSSGTFTNTGGTMNIAGAWTHTAGGTFAHNDGLVVWDKNGGVTFDFDSGQTGSGEFYDFNVSAPVAATRTLSIAAGDALVVNGDLTLTRGVLNDNSGSYADVKGNVTVASTWEGGDCPIHFTHGSEDQTFDLTGATDKHNGPVVVNKAGGSVLMASDLDMDVYQKDFTLTAGNFNLSGYDFTLGTSSNANTLTVTAGAFISGSGTVNMDGDVVLNGGTFTATSGTMTVAGDWTHTASGATFEHANGTMTWDKGNAAATWDFGEGTGSGAFYDFNVASSVAATRQFSIATDDTLTVNNNLTLTQGTINGNGTSHFDVKGNVTVESTFEGGDAPVHFTHASNDQTFDLTGGTDKHNGDVVVNKVAGSVILSSILDMDANGQDLTVTEGTLDLNGNNLIVDNGLNDGTLVIEDGGTLRMQGAETLTLETGYPQLDSGSTVTYDPSSGTTTITDYAYHHLTIASSGSAVVQLGAAESLAGNFTINSGAVFYTNGYILGITGTFSNEGTLRLVGTEQLAFSNDTNSGTVEYVGDGDAAADAYVLQNWATYYDLDVNFDDSADSTSGTGTLGTDTLSDNLWLYWKLDDGTGATTANDETANNYDGTLNNMDENSVWVSGSSAINFTNTGAVDFAGDNDTIEFTSDGAFNDRSVSLWFRSSDVTTQAVLYEEGGTGAGMNIYLDGGSVYTGVWGSGITNSWLSGSVSVDTWYNVVSVFDHDGNFELFINGTSQGTAVPNGDVPAHSAQDAIGGKLDGTMLNGSVSSSGAGLYYGGEIDDFRIYSRTLNSAEIAGLAAGNDVSTTSVDLSSVTTNDFTMAGGTFTAPAAMSVGGNWNETGGTFTHNDGAVTVTGSSSSVTATDSFYDFTVNSSGTVTLGAALDVANTVTLTAGALDVSATPYGISTAAWTDSGAGTFTERTGTVTFDGTGTLSANEAFNDVTINTAGTVTLGAELDVDDDLTITAGTLAVGVGNHGINVGGDWANSDTFTQGSGIVVFDTTTASAVSGNTTFNNLNCVTANKTITFTAGSTTTVSGTLTLTGAPSQLITLQSSDTAVWNLVVNGTTDIDYVNVSYSNASGTASPVEPGDNSTDGLNNVGWSFNDVPTVASVTAVLGADGAGDVTITFIMDDPDDDDTLQAKIEYSVNGGGAWADPTLSTTGSETSATYGDPGIDNAAVTYQVGTGAAYITSSSGANTVSIVWEAATDVASSTDVSNAQIKVTPYDGTAAGTAGTSSNFVLDVVAPSGLTELSYGDFSLGNIVLSWSAVTETNFDHYELWHGTSQSDVQNRNGAASEWDNDNDPALATVATSSTNVTVDPRNKYYKIFAVDDYGNVGTVTEVYLGGVSASASSSSITVGEVSDVSVTDYAGGGVEITWEDPDDDSTDVQILRGVNGLVNGTPIATVAIGEEFYVDTDVEVGDTVTYQLRATNGSATGDLTDELSFVVGSTLDSEEEEEEVVEEESTTVDEVVEEEAEEEEEIVEEVSGTDDDEETDEEIVEEEEEETVEELGVEMPTGWAAGYFRWLGEDENIYAAAIADDDYVTFLENMFENPDEGLSRGGAVWLLATLTGKDLTGVYKQEFSDVDSALGAYEAIQVSFEEGLVGGYEDGTFRPDNLLNRAEAMKLLTGFFEAPVNGGENPFEDVDEDAWYAPYVGLAYSNGLISARDEGMFNPSDTMTNTDFVKIVLLANDAWGGGVEEEVVEEVEEEDVVEEEEITHTIEDIDMEVLEDHWSKGYLENLVEEELLDEEIQSESFFTLLTDIVTDPDKGMTRGEAMQFLVTLAGYDVPVVTETSFTDLDADHERAPYIQYAYDQRLINGYPDGTFKPDQVLNRVEALKIIMVFFEKDVEEPPSGDELLVLYGLDENPFDDLSLDAWYAAYVLRAFADGVVQGYGDGSFGPADEISYGAFVKISTLVKELEDAVQLSSLLE